MSELKHCTKCEQKYPATTEFFYGRKQGKAGLDSWCKRCRKAYNSTPEQIARRVEYNRGWRKRNPDKVAARERRRRAINPEKNKAKLYRWRANNPEKVKATQKRWRAKHPEYNKKYYATHKEEDRERGRRWQENNKAKVSARQRRWKANHPEEARAREKANTARRRSANGSFTARDVRLQIKAQTDKKGVLHCWWCDKPIKDKYHVDHRIPIKKGGSNNPGNICIAHVKCNLSKGAKLPHEWNGRLL